MKIENCGLLWIIPTLIPVLFGEKAMMWWRAFQRFFKEPWEQKEFCLIVLLHWWSEETVEAQTRGAGWVYALIQQQEHHQLHLGLTLGVHRSSCQCPDRAGDWLAPITCPEDYIELGQFSGLALMNRAWEHNWGDGCQWAKVDLYNKEPF